MFIRESPQEKAELPSQPTRELTQMKRHRAGVWDVG